MIAVLATAAFALAAAVGALGSLSPRGRAVVAAVIGVSLPIAIAGHWILIARATRRLDARAADDGVGAPGPPRRPAAAHDDRSGDAEFWRLVLDGPRRPWWAPLAMIAAGFVLLVPRAAGVVLIVVGAWWCVSRVAQRMANTAIASGAACLRCKYDLTGLPTGVCPECGYDNEPARRDAASRIRPDETAGRRDAPPAA